MITGLVTNTVCSGWPANLQCEASIFSTARARLGLFFSSFQDGVFTLTARLAPVSAACIAVNLPLPRMLLVQLEKSCNEWLVQPVIASASTRTSGTSSIHHIGVLTLWRA